MARTDIAVVGAGPAGLAVGVAARQQGLSCILFEKGCLTQCIAAYPTYATFFSTPENLEIGGLPFLTVEDKPRRREALKYYRRVARHFELDVRQYEEVIGVAGRRGDFRLDTRRRDGREFTHAAANVVVATGYYDSPNLLGVPGEELPKVSHYYTEAHPYFDQDVIVVGGGNSAVEAALELFRAGARVRLVHFEDRLDAGVKPWILPDITNRLQRGEITPHWRARIVEIRPDAAVLRSDEDGTATEVPNDWVLAMTGYTPDPALLRSLGVTVDPVTRIPAHDSATMETDVPGVFIAGVVAAGNRPNKIFIENGREHGPRIARALAGGGKAAADVA